MNNCLELQVLAGDEPLGYGILDFRNSGSSRELLDELRFRAVGLHPYLAKTRIDVSVDVEALSNSVVLQAWSTESSQRSLAELYVPARNFSWFGHTVAQALGLRGGYRIQVAARKSSDSQLDDQESYTIEEENPGVYLPDAECFTTKPFGPTDVLHRSESWLKCVFTPSSFCEFTEAARDEHLQTEIAFLGSSRIHFVDGHCCVVIDALTRIEGEATPLQITTNAQQFYDAYQRIGPRFGAFLHTHPKSVKGPDGQAIQLSPEPSGPDLVVALKTNSSSLTPVVMPIAMSPFGDPERDIAAWGFRGGVLAQLNLEVLR